MKMTNALLTCFAPSSPSYANRLAGELFSSLAIDLKQLQKSLEKSPPLQWCSEAMLVVKKTHSQIMLFFEITKDHEPWLGSTMVDEYMNASLDLLDLCNLIKSAITTLNRHRMMVDFMVKSVKDASFMSMVSKIELERNEIEKSNNLFKLWKWREMNLNKSIISKSKLANRTEMNILQPVSNTMSIISLFIFCSIQYPIPIKIYEGFYNGFQTKDLFSESVRKLTFTFGEKLKHVQGKGRSVLHENEMIDDALIAFTAELVSVKAGGEGGKIAERLDELRDSSVALKQGIDMLESVVNELFEEVIKGRKKVIDLISTNNYS